MHSINPALNVRAQRVGAFGQTGIGEVERTMSEFEEEREGKERRMGKRMKS